MNYDTLIAIPSLLRQGVVYRVARMSFGRRVELMKQVRELAGRLEFLRAGPTDSDRMDAGILAAEIDRLYVTWGLREVFGLTIDARIATPESLASDGPEDLFQEALTAVKMECGLSELERKN